MITVFLRVLEELNDKESALKSAICNPQAALGRQRFDVNVNSFAAVPRSPFAYWVSDRLRGLFKALPLFETEGRTAKQGLATADDFRFVRSWWAVPPRRTGPADGIWFPFAKGGKVSPFYADIYLMVNWDANGDALESFGGSVIRNPNFFFRPGLTWPRRTKSELSFRVMPAGCIFADKGPAAFDKCDDSEKLLSLVAIVSSKAFRSLVEFQLAAADARAGGAAHSYEVGVIQRTPVPNLNMEDQHSIAQLARRAWTLKRIPDTASETTHAFLLPAILQVEGGSLVERANFWQAKIRTSEETLAGIRADIDALCFGFYGIDAADERTICEGFSVRASDAEESSNIDTDSDADSDEEVEPDAVADAASTAADLVSWAVGVAFGRFDVRLVSNFGLQPEHTEPFAPMPLCSPGMLTGDDGMPVAHVPPGYPLSFPLSGILVEDLGHADDLTTAVRSVFEEVFASGADLWWDEVGSGPAPKQHDLRFWLRSSLFDHHIKRYSKSRRKAPILWQLAVPSGRYAVWLYAHRLSSDSLFRLLNDVVTPKLAHEERQLTSLIQAAGELPTAKERKEIAEQDALVEELRSFLDEVKRVAPLWHPRLDDGVVLTMAPLWRLVPQHQPWQKELRARWDELVEQKYDWSHVAMHFWPERVVPKCATDRSIAIAHGLDAAFWVQAISGRWRQRVGIADTVHYLEENLTSARLRQTVEELVAFSKSYAAASGDAPDWWAALSTGFHDDTALALALWPERVIKKAVADPDRFAALGIKLPRARNGDELMAKLLSMHRPRLLDQEIQTLGEFCDSAGNREYWSLRWEQFASGIHDECGLARAVHTSRVVAKSQADPDFAKFHDLFRWFWLLGKSGPRRLKEPVDEIADALRIRSSLAVKAALKSSVEAPTATVSGVRGRGRRPTTAAPAGGTY